MAEDVELIVIIPF